MSDDLFPLPLTAFEEFMLLDGPPPMDAWVELGFVGRLSRPALLEAVAGLHERHPLLTARVEAHGGRRYWIARPSPVPVVFVDAGEPWPDLPLDPVSGRGATIYVRDETLYLHLHHACCDGSGARVLFLDLAAQYAYASAPGGDWPRLPRMDAGRLRTRGRVAGAAADVPAPGTWKILRDVMNFLVPLPQRLAPEPGPGHGPPFSRTVLEPEETARALEVAGRSTSGKLHDKALSDFFGSLADWQRARGRSAGRLRALIPWDLRQLADRRMPACNHVSFAFLDRDVRECGPDLSAGLRAEHEYIREYRTDLDFLRVLELVRSLGVLPLGLRLPISLSTAVFNDMGDVTPLRKFPLTPQGGVVGDVVFRYAVGVAPVRRGTAAALGLCRLGGRLAVALRCDRRLLGQDAEERLLADFRRRLTGAGTPAPR